MKVFFPGWNYVMSVAGWASFPQGCRYVSPAMTEDTQGTCSPSLGINSTALANMKPWIVNDWDLGMYFLCESVEILLWLQFCIRLITYYDNATCNR